MSETGPILNPEALLQEEQRRREWITLKSGRVCVWELSVPELMQITEKSQRPRIDPRGGMDPTESVLWQIMLSLFDGDGDGAKRIFDPQNPQHAKAVFRMGAQDFKRIMEVIARVNGSDEVELEALRAFTGATTAAEC
jgi:hypothetical protein